MCRPVTKPKLLQNLSQSDNVCPVALKRMCKLDFSKSIGWAALHLPIRGHERYFIDFGQLSQAVHNLLPLYKAVSNDSHTHLPLSLASREIPPVLPVQS